MVSGLFSDLESRLFSLDGKRGVMLRDTVKSALKTCKWDSVSTLLTDLAVVEDGAEQTEVQDTEPVSLSSFCDASHDDLRSLIATKYRLAAVGRG